MRLAPAWGETGCLLPQPVEDERRRDGASVSQDRIAGEDYEPHYEGRRFSPNRQLPPPRSPHPCPLSRPLATPLPRRGEPGWSGLAGLPRPSPLPSLSSFLAF